MPDLDPTAEFQPPVTPEAAPEPKPEAPPAASVADLQALQAQVATLASKAATLDKLAGVLAPPSVAASTPQDDAIRAEIFRLFPALRTYEADTAQMKKALVAVAQATGYAADAALTERTSKADDLTKSLMRAEKMSTDADALYDVSVMIASRIQRDPALKDAWNRGHVKYAVEEAWKKVSEKLLAPIRVEAKRGAVTSILDAPRATPRGGAQSPPSGKDPNKLDFADTSREGRKKIHEAAFARLQQTD